MGWLEEQAKRAAEKKRKADKEATDLKIRGVVFTP